MSERTINYYIAYSVDNIIYADYFDIPIRLVEYMCPSNIKSELELPENAIIISWQREE